MTRKRKAPNMSEKLASALLHIRRGVEGGDWLISGELRKASAREICSAVDFDHVRRWAENGSNDPQNLQPLIRAEHKVKTNTIDKPEIAKGKRFADKEDDFRRRLLAKQAGEEIEKPKLTKKGYRKLPTKEERRAFLEKVRS